MFRICAELNLACTNEVVTGTNVIDGRVEGWGFEVAVELPYGTEMVWFFGVDNVHHFAAWAPM
jgi:hypothetical protein